MSEPIDELYFRWLYSQVANETRRSKSRSFWTLFRQLYTTEFVWLIPNDDNRVEDGKDLRDLFLQELELSGDEVDDDWLAIGCSFLELLIGLSNRMEFDTSVSARYWFWHILGNLGLAASNDRHPLDSDLVEEVLNTVIWRNYAKNGSGGLFPLSRPCLDQRKVELWYQLSAYLQEME